MAYIILGLDLIERFTLGQPYLFEVRRGETRGLFKLGREVRWTTVIKFKCNFREGHLSVDKQFLGFFNPLLNKIILDGPPFHRGEYTAEMGVFVVELSGEIGR